MNWRFVCPQKSSADILTTNVLEWGGGALERCLGKQGGDLTSGISVLVKEMAEPSLTPTVWGHSKK